MKQYDPNRVWERVQSPPVPDSQSLEPLVRILWQQTRIFQQLTKKLPLPQAAVARELQKQFQQQLTCLKGMLILISGAPSPNPPSPASGDPPELLLRQAYAQSLRLRTEYEARRSDAAYGHIFRLFSNRLPEQAADILMLLGTMAKP